jgi:hypothetical protein
MTGGWKQSRKAAGMPQARYCNTSPIVTIQPDRRRRASDVATQMLESTSATNGWATRSSRWWRLCIPLDSDIRRRVGRFPCPCALWLSQS